MVILPSPVECVCSVWIVLCTEVNLSISLLPQNAQRLGASQVTQPLTTPVVSVATPSLLTPFSMPTAYNTGKRVNNMDTWWDGANKNNCLRTNKVSSRGAAHQQFLHSLKSWSKHGDEIFPNLNLPLFHLLFPFSRFHICRVSADECRSHGPSGFHTTGCTVAE